jgi:hypothetical protein
MPSDVYTTPTLDLVRRKYHEQLQLVGLDILQSAAASGRPADHIAHMLDVVRDSYGPREATYLAQFVMALAEERKLLGV